MSKHDRWARKPSLPEMLEPGAIVKYNGPSPPLMQPPLPIRIHFQKSITVKFSGPMAALAGAQGLGNITTDTSKILAQDAAGIMIDLDGRCAFIPWANVAWIETL